MKDTEETEVTKKWTQRGKGGKGKQCDKEVFMVVLGEREGR